jgi:peroxiredoxin Q/BCP
MLIPIGQTAPNFLLPSTTGFGFDLATKASYKPLILFFYEKSSNPFYLQQAKAYATVYEELNALGLDVVGINTDTPEANARFKERLQLPFNLLADPSGRVAAQYGIESRIFPFNKNVSYLVDQQQIVRGVFSNLLNAQKHIAIIMQKVKQQQLVHLPQYQRNYSSYFYR